MRLALTLVTTALLAAGQSFDVASIKPHPRDNFNTSFNSGPGRISWSGIALRGYMMSAYGIDSDQVSGGPSWVNDDRYDLEAQVDGMTARLTEEQLQPLVQNLLAERFGLKVHKETREMSVFVLLEGPKGHKLQAHKAGEPSSMVMRSADSRTRLNIKGYTMPKIAKQLLNSIGKRVVDGTGLPGEYDFILDWTDTLRSETGVSITTAIQEQLGLRLEERRMPVEVYVIDAVQRPSEN